MAVDDISVDCLSVDDQSVDNLSVDYLSVDDLSVDDLYVDILSVDDLSARRLQNCTHRVHITSYCAIAHMSPIRSPPLEKTCAEEVSNRSSSHPAKTCASSSTS